MSSTDTPKSAKSLVVRKNSEGLPDWHVQQELILKKWSEIGSSYRYLHDKAFQKYTNQNLWFALPVIIISTVTGTANFAQGSFPPSWATYVPLGIGFLNLAAGLITTIAQFLKVSELLEGHRAASLAYSKFSRNISVELSLPIKERTDDGSNFINNSRAELDRLIEQSPNIPEALIKLFMKRFPEPDYDVSGVPSNNYDFFRPEILDIRPIKIYRDDVEELARKKEKQRKLKLEISNKEAIRLRKEMKNNEAEREKVKEEARQEFHEYNEKQKKDIAKIFELAQINTQKQLLRNNFSTNNIEDSMNDLLGNLKSNIAEVSDYTDSDSEESSHNSPIHKPIQETIEQSTEKVVSITINEVASEQSDGSDSGATLDEHEETDDGTNEIINNNIGDENETSGGNSNNDISGNNV